MAGGPGTVDFMFSNQDGGEGCKTNPSQSSADVTLRQLRSVINDNLICLGLTGALVMVTVLVVAYVASAVYGLVSSWRAGVASSRLSRERGEKVPKPASVNDDVVYKPRRFVSAGSRAGQQGVPEATLVRNAIKTLNVRYGDYNSAVKRYAANRKDGEAADDLIDERVLSRESDDYRYDRGEAKGGMVVRKGQGAELVASDADVKAGARARQRGEGQVHGGAGQGGGAAGPHKGGDIPRNRAVGLDDDHRGGDAFEIAASGGGE